MTNAYPRCARRLDHVLTSNTFEAMRIYSYIHIYIDAYTQTNMSANIQGTYTDTDTDTDK